MTASETNKSPSFRPILESAALITGGSVIYALGLNGIMVPNHILTGGVVGIAMIGHYAVPAVSVGLFYLLLNIPLAAIGWFTVSRRFLFYSIFGTAVFSLAAVAAEPPVPEIRDPILAALSSGVICGFGAGLILRSAGSAGGMDILGVSLSKKFGFRIGQVVFIANAAVLTAGAFLYDVQVALYSMVYLFVTGRVTDSVITGFNRRKSLIVISDRARAIADKILSSEGRGVTFLKGEGAFSRQEKNVIFTITTLRELPKIKETILAIDPEAFLVVNDTLEVLGKRHGRGRVY